MKISTKAVIGIREFLFNYVMQKDKDDNLTSKLTHQDMVIYLFEKEYNVPNRVCFDRIKKQDILSGNILIVKDEMGKVIPYRNPRRVSLSSLERELNSEKVRKNNLRKRREFLSEQGLVELLSGQIVSENMFEESDLNRVSEHVNRQKKLLNRYGYKMKGM